MTAWASFYPHVLPYVSGAPSLMVDQALRDAAREFCRESRAWVEQAAAVTGDGTTRQRSFVFASGSELVEVRRATVAGEDMTILSSRQMPADWQEDTPDAAALHDTLVVLNSQAAYVLYPIPADGAEIIIYQALMPTMTATGVGDVIFTEYGEQMAKGAIARLCSMPKKPWSDVDAAALAAAAFERGIHSAANRVFRQGQRRVKKAPL